MRPRVFIRPALKGALVRHHPTMPYAMTDGKCQDSGVRQSCNVGKFSNVFRDEPILTPDEARVYRRPNGRQRHRLAGIRPSMPE